MTSFDRPDRIRTLVAAVLSWHLPNPERWREYVVEILAERDLIIEDGELFDEAGFIGEADLLEPDEALGLTRTSPNPRCAWSAR